MLQQENELCGYNPRWVICCRWWERAFLLLHLLNHKLEGLGPHCFFSLLKLPPRSRAALGTLISTLHPNIQANCCLGLRVGWEEYIYYHWDQESLAISPDFGPVRRMARWGSWLAKNNHCLVGHCCPSHLRLDCSVEKVNRTHMKINKQEAGFIIQNDELPWNIWIWRLTHNSILE